jgi:hypothetical protein
MRRGIALWRAATPGVSAEVTAMSLQRSSGTVGERAEGRGEGRGVASTMERKARRAVQVERLSLMNCGLEEATARITEAHKR